MRIRKLRKEDEAGARKLILGVMDKEFGNPVSYPAHDLIDIEKSYGGQRDVFLVAREDNNVIGTVAIKEDDEKTALLRRLFVDPVYRNKGYGKRLLRSAISYCKKYDYRKIVIRTTDRMEAAIGLCKKNGFREDDKGEMGIFELIELIFEM